MDAKQLVDEAIDGYQGDDLQAVLIGSDWWDEFVELIGAHPTSVGGDDVEVSYRALSCRRSVTPDEITLVTGY